VGVVCCSHRCQSQRWAWFVVYIAVNHSGGRGLLFTSLSITAVGVVNVVTYHSERSRDDSLPWRQ